MVFGKIKNKKRKKQLQKQINELEVKMSRAQAGYVQSVLQNGTPNPEDIEFHEKYMKEIEKLRDEIRLLG